MGSRRKEDHRYVDPQAPTPVTKNRVMYNAVLLVDSIRVRANDVRREKRNEDPKSVSSIRGPPAPRMVPSSWWPISLHSKLCPVPAYSPLRRSSPLCSQRRCFRVPTCIFSIDAPSSLSNLARSCSNRTSFESDFGAAAAAPESMDLKTKSGADFPHFGRSDAVILTVTVAAVEYEEVK